MNILFFFLEMWPRGQRWLTVWKIDAHLLKKCMRRKSQKLNIIRKEMQNNEEEEFDLWLELLLFFLFSPVTHRINWTVFRLIPVHHHHEDEIGRRYVLKGTTQLNDYELSVTASQEITIVFRGHSSHKTLRKMHDSSSFLGYLHSFCKGGPIITKLLQKNVYHPFKLTTSDQLEFFRQRSLY